MKNADELTRLSSDDGVLELSDAPAQRFESGSPPVGRFGNGQKKYLWVVATRGCPSILEEGPAAAGLSRGAVSHSNLTGGDEAHAGGELWFNDDSSIWLSGGSSRYVPRDERELEHVANCFRAAGYLVASFGWDQEVAGPVRFLRGEAQWA